ncbi:MAG: hypothetical protein OXU81_02905, partial [Gammaproteobacteria bacterium]|nr:hypothetical protein [Gammaproteobacteria bacterium]
MLQLHGSAQPARIFSEVGAPSTISQRNHPFIENSACLFRQLVTDPSQHFVPSSHVVAILVEPESLRTTLCELLLRGGRGLAVGGKVILGISLLGELDPEALVRAPLRIPVIPITDSSVMPITDS